MKKTTISIMMVLTISILITGCGTNIPNLSEEQTDLVTEYAAGLLIKYNSIPSRSLLNDAQLEAEGKKEAEEREKERKKEEAAKAYLESQDTAKTKNKKENSDKNKSPVISDLATFYGLEGFTILYSGYQLCQSYPDESRDDYFLAMDATEGKQLCILQFNVTNTAGEDKQFDMFEKKPLFYLSIDGKDKIPVQPTLLLDDLSSYKGTITASNLEQMVLVFEIDGSLSQLGTMELTARYGDQKGLLNLQ